jgi:hypothetical protein
MINIEVLVKGTNNIVIKSQLFDLHTKIKFNKFYVIEFYQIIDYFNLKKKKKIIIAFQRKKSKRQSFK